MVITRLRGLLVLCMAGLLLGGCASQEPADSGPDMAPIEQAPDTSAAAEETMAPAGPVVENGKIVIPMNDSGSMTEMLNGIFYFDFDQAIVKRTGHEELDKHARVLAGDRYLRVRLEGHADERGTREYNLALGARRAAAVRQYLASRGINPNRLKMISYGKERPADRGTTEAAWAKNRRTVIRVNPS